MAQEMKDYTEIQNGALPSLDETVLGAPEGKKKSKTNVGKFAVLGIVLTGFLFIVAGLLIWQKNRNSTDAAQRARVAEKPGFSTKNTAVESESIDKVKAALRQKEAEERARIKAIEDAQEEARRAAAAEDAARRAAMAKTPGNAPAGGSNVPPPPPVETPRERKLAGGVLLASTGSAAAGGGSELSEQDVRQREAAARTAALGVNPRGANLAGARQGGGRGGSDALSSRLQPTILATSAAGRLPNLDFLLKQGTTIPCALKTGIDTTLPGFVMCTVVSDVYSANGKTLLAERGGTLFGEQQSSLKQGQERTFVVWSRLDNPNGVFANIDSPAVDQMGFSGIPGYVDTHFWQRFGGAIMLSLISDFSQAYAQKVSNSNNSGRGGNGQAPLENTQAAGQDMATEALRNSINIPPRLVVNPATVINVLVARDVSFEGVFALSSGE